MVCFYVFATHQSRPFLPAPFPFPPSSHSTRFFSDNCALFSATANPQPFWKQSIPHSFHLDGGIPPLFPFWNSPHVAHSPFFSITYAVPILQVFSFDTHPSNGGCTPSRRPGCSNRQTFPRVTDLSPFFPCYCALFCTFLRLSKIQLFYFQSLPYSLRKTPGGGVYLNPYLPTTLPPYFRGPRVTSHQSR